MSTPEDSARKAQLATLSYLWTSGEWGLHAIERRGAKVYLVFPAGGVSLKELLAVRALVPRLGESPVAVLKAEVAGLPEYFVGEFGTSDARSFAIAADRKGLKARIEEFVTTDYLPMNLKGGALEVGDEALAAMAGKEMHRRKLPVVVQEEYDGSYHYRRDVTLHAKNEPVPFDVKQAPASAEEIRGLIGDAGMALPAAYLEFLRHSNGAECGPNDEPGDSLRILPSHEVKSYNERFGIQRVLPGLLAFASDGGDHAFCFKVSPETSPDDPEVIRIGLAAISLDEGLFVAFSFKAWHQDGFRYPIC